MTLEADVQQGWHDAIIEMFDIDLSPITNDPADIFYFVNELNEDGTKVQWKGNVYEPLPILSAGYDRNTNGQIAQPTLTLSNISNAFTGIASLYDDLVGAKVTRRRTLKKYLDGSPEADPLQEFPVDIFYFERKTQESIISITWQLSSILDLQGVKLPRRVITQNLCLWKYRGAECGYTGAPVFNSRDEVISAVGQTSQGIVTLNAWRLRDQRKAELQAAIQNYNQALGAQEAACAPFAFLEAKYQTTALPISRVRRAADGDDVSDRYNARFDGVVVTLGEVYRQGKQREIITGLNLQKIYLYEIERWGPNPAACTAAGVAVTAAAGAVTVAQSNLNSAEAALAAALALLPANDPLRLEDVCGKRVSSCALHFPGQSLPFGGFPGANVVRG
jgi:lambda family phage minor tail protein L